MKTVYDIKPLGFHWEMYDPFLFCAHHKDQYPKGNENFGPDPELLAGRDIGSDFVVKDGFRMYHGDTVPGFPVHPHRGFETVTITLEGLIDHADSLGGAGRYGNGDVQWMTAGKGIQHTEMFPLLNQEKENPLELLQIWVNLPKKDKFVEPNYKMLWSEEIPVILEKDATGNTNKIMIIAGAFNGTKAVSPTPDSWAADPANEVGIWIVEMEPGAHLDLPVASDGVARTIYNYRGEGIAVGDEAVPRYHQAKLNASASLQVQNSNAATTFLVVQGKPIGEPVAQYGPFVMNTRGEIQQAYQDYTETRFGGWPWDRHDPVHGKEARRFAKFTDGTVIHP
jgi:quercetin 2,3-dioxygenase